MELDYAEIERIHNLAMECCDYALLARRKGDDKERIVNLVKAFHFERTAAEMLIDHKELEPTRAILFRSAATIALELDKNDEAKRLVEIALAGNPYPKHIEELQEVLDAVEGKHALLGGFIQKH